MCQVLLYMMLWKWIIFLSLLYCQNFNNVQVHGQSPTAATTTPYSIRINAGAGTTYTDTLTGKVWWLDNPTQYTNGNGKTYGVKNTTACFSYIANTSEDRIYCTQRFFTTGKPFQYNVPVPSGTFQYDITLHFAEIYHVAAGKRVFDVYVEGTAVANNLDIFQTVGSNTALVIATRQSISDGAVTIELVQKVGEPFISAIEVVQVLPSPIPLPVPAPVPVAIPLPTPTSPNTVPTTNILVATRINVGGSQYVDTLGNVWMGDAYFEKKGKVFNICTSAIVPIVNTVEDGLYCTSRYFQKSTTLPPFQYQIPIPTTSTAQFNVRLHFMDSVSNKTYGRKTPVFSFLATFSQHFFHPTIATRSTLPRLGNESLMSASKVH
jgi:Malectin domain